MSGTEALNAPYLTVNFWTMLHKRGCWLSALFLGEMLTATAMTHFENEIARAVVLASRLVRSDQGAKGLAD
jgi:magnesium transporter